MNLNKGEKFIVKDKEGTKYLAGVIKRIERGVILRHKELPADDEKNKDSEEYVKIIISERIVEG